LPGPLAGWYRRFGITESDGNPRLVSTGSSRP
ncbi:MAG: hypothetical protein QG608_2364, partial [Actinomycetota bacterium]|nr:hypothetical protein [Actinomycetota bacterium]